VVVMDDENICFVECKWQNSVNRERVLHQLIKKSHIIKHDLKESFLVVCKGDL